MSRGVRGNALVKASERLPKERRILLGVKFAHPPECGEQDQSPGSVSGRPSRTCVERKDPRFADFSGIHVNHLYGLWSGSRNERIVVQQQNRLDYPHKLAARHRFRHRDRDGQGTRGKVAIHDQGIARTYLTKIQ